MATATQPKPGTIARSSYGQMRALLQKHKDVDVAARAYLASLNVNALRSMLFPQVRHSFVIISRSVSGLKEVKAFPQPQSGESYVGIDLAELVDATFGLPDGRRIPWLTATVEEHRLHAELQRALAAGCLADAERHDLAVAAIEEAGVTCLAEIKS